MTWRRLALGSAWLLSLAVAARTGVFLSDNWDAILRRLGQVETSGLLESNLYAIGMQLLPVPIDGRYGAIAPLRNGVLFASRSGRMFYVDSARTVHALAVRVPVDVEAFESFPGNASVVDKDHFAVKDLITQSTSDELRFIVSHSYWDAGLRCYGVRVSSITLPLDTALSRATGEWQTLYETRPCRTLSLLANGQRRPTIGAGGRMALLSDHELLLTVGTFGTENAGEDEEGTALDPGSPYGKTVVVDLVTRESRIFTSGHRNPQGLAIGPDERIWLTEHAARGGDELNLLREGADYGFPSVAYGTAYGSLLYPPGVALGRHEGFEKPMHAWVPSIATSQLVAVAGEPFAHWRGDLIVSSLAARSLFRVRVEEGRVIYVEPIRIGYRLRDIIETSRGELVLLAEDGYLIYLAPVDEDATDPNLLPRERGQLVASRCQGCHTFEEGGMSGLGPNLHGIVGRRIGSSDGFNYSAALGGKDGRWSEDDLRTFIADPQAFAPGTTMATGFMLTDDQFSDLFTYLRGLQ